MKEKIKELIECNGSLEERKVALKVFSNIFIKIFTENINNEGFVNGIKDLIDSDIDTVTLYQKIYELSKIKNKQRGCENYTNNNKLSHLKIKLNGGNPVVLCSNCDKIIRPSTSGEYLNPKLYSSEYCDECLQLLIREVGKIKLKD